MTKNTMKTNTTTNRTAEELYTENGKKVFLALRARHRNTAQQFITDLQNSWHNDEQCQKAPQIAEQITALQVELDTLQDELAELEKIRSMCDRASTSLKHNEQHRRAYKQTADQTAQRMAILKNRTAELHKNIDILFNALDYTFSDRMDILQTAILQDLENQHTPQPIPQKILSAYGVESAEELTEEELAQAQSTANNDRIFSAIGKHIESMRALNTHTATRTDILEPLPQEILAQFGNDTISFDGYLFQWQPKTTDPTQGEYRHNLKQGQYLSFDYKEYKQNRKSGWYLVKHRLTIRNVSRLEEYTNEDGEQIDITALLPNFTEWELVDDITALKNIIDTAELPPRYRQFCTALISPQAEEIADTMRIKYFNECDRIGTEPTNKGAIKTEYNSRIEYACKYIGIETYENRKKFLQRLRKYF